MQKACPRILSSPEIARIKARFEISFDDNTLMTFRGYDNESSGKKNEYYLHRSFFFASVAFINQQSFQCNDIHR